MPRGFRNELIGRLLLPLLMAVATLAHAQVNTFRPNIILIVADDLGQQTISAYQKRHSKPIVRTLHADRIANAGMRFNNAYSTSSVGGPSRFGILTGTYPWRRNLLTTPAPDQTYLLATNEVTLPLLLQKSGYATGYIGKWGLGFQSGEKVVWNQPLSPGPNEAGFDYFFGFAASHDQAPHCWIKNSSIVGRHPGEDLVITEDGETKGISLVRDKDQISPTLAKEAQRFIEEHRDEPFFLYFAPTALRPPAHAAPFLKGKSGKGEFGDYLADLDWQIGRLILEVNRQNLAHRTLFILTADNGGVASMGIEAGIQTNGSLRGGKGDIHEGGLRVPFMVKWDHRIPNYELNTNLISTVDIMATVCAVADVEIPEGAAPDSKNFLSEFYFAAVKGVPRTTVITASDNGTEFAIRSGNWKLIRTNGLPGLSIQGQEDSKAQPVLYDLDTDSSESIDSAIANEELVRDLSNELEEQLLQTSQPVFFSTNRLPGLEFPSVLIEPEWLHKNLSHPDLLVLDARTVEEYGEGHIQGAVSLPRKSTYHTNELYKTMRAPSADLERLFNSKGIRKDHRIVVYDNKNFRDAARLFWVLETCGLPRVAVLNGGLKAWKEAELPVATESTVLPEGDFVVTPVPHLSPKGQDVYYATMDQRVTLLDSRSIEEFQGEKSVTEKKGHIPTALPFPFDANLSSENTCRFINFADLERHFRSIPRDNRVITYCNSGTRASVNYLALRLLGYDAAVYDGSWIEWSKTPDAPIGVPYGPEPEPHPKDEKK